MLKTTQTLSEYEGEDMTDRTIAAISTAQGEGGIGIIRISGTEAIAVADRVFRSVGEKPLCALKGYRASYGKIVSQNQIIDEAVAIVYRAPHSYTGEDVVELCCHGGLYVTRQVLRTVIDEGASLAEPGEFTKRAFINGKMDLCEAQSVMDIISAQSRQAARAAVSVRQGALSVKINTMKSKLLSLAAHLSAWADFPEEDIPEVQDTAVLSDLQFCEKTLVKLLQDYEKGKAVTKGVDTVIAGKPNVGKSTLMNLLSGFEKSIVTEIPGTTRDVVEESVIVGDVTLRLSDTAGIRETDNEVEKIGVLRAKEKLNSSALVLAVFDGSREFDEEDKHLINSLEGIPTVAIVNKTDLELKFDTSYLNEKIGKIVYISAKEGDGKDDLEQAVTELLGTKDFNPSEGILSTERQREATQKALNSVRDAVNTLTFGYSLDAVTVCVEDAIESLLSLTGENLSETVVNEVFHNFCLGK